MRSHQLRRAPLLAACTVVAALFAVPAAQAASVPPVLGENNPTCEDYGMTTIYKFEGSELANGTKAGITISGVDIDNGTFDWSSTVAVDAVIAKGGNDGNVYIYPFDTFGDTDLVTPTNPNNGRPYGLSHVEFCTDGVPETPPEPGLEIVKDGPDSAEVGEEVTWTFAVTNTGDESLTDLEVGDDECAPLVRDPDETDTSFDPGDVWHYTCTREVTSADGDAIHNTATACADAESQDEPVCDTDDHELTIPNPAIVLDKATEVEFVYGGDAVLYTFDVTNSGDVAYSGDDVLLTDSKCEDTPELEDKSGGDDDDSFEPGETWRYTCTVTVPVDASGSFDNEAEVCIEQEGDDFPCDEDEVTVPVRTIAIDVIKNAVETTAVAGSDVNFTISVSNTGNTDFVDYEFVDPTCKSITRTGANAADTTLNAGETWTYACVQATAATDTSATNTATATGTNDDDKSATDTDDASVPLTAPPVNPPVVPPVVPPVIPPAGGELPEEVISGRAALRGPSGCVKQAFRARVSGREIASVTFFLDGKRIKRLTGERSVYSVKIRPNSLQFGRHRVVARVQFTAESETASRRLPLTFRRCGRGAVAPRFTG